METTARAKVRVNLKGTLAGALDVSKPWFIRPDLLCSQPSLWTPAHAQLWLTFLESEDNEQHQGKYWKLSIMGIMVMVHSIYFDSGDRRQAEDLFWL